MFVSDISHGKNWMTYYYKSTEVLMESTRYSPHILTFWRWFFFYFSTPCIYNVNNTGTEYVRIMKQTVFWREKKNGEYILRLNIQYLYLLNKYIKCNV